MIKRAGSSLLAAAMLLCSLQPSFSETDHLNVDQTKTSDVFVRRTDPTYRYGVLAFAPVATPTDILVIQGSATRTIHIKRIQLQGAATAAGNMPVQIVRRSTADTTTCVLTPITGVKHDTNDVAASAVISTIGTANCGALGTLVGLLGTGRLQMTALSTGLSIYPTVWDFGGVRLDKALLLRGTSDFIAINLNGAAIPAGGVVDIEIETEEPVQQ